MSNVGLVGGVCAPLYGKNDGSGRIGIQNVLPYAAEQAGNFMNASGANTLIVGTAAGTVAATAKSKAVEGQVLKLGGKLGEVLNKSKIYENGVKGCKAIAKEIFKPEVISKLKNMPTWGKVAAALAVPVMALTGFVQNKLMFDSGATHQKYVDRTALQEATGNLI